MSETGVSRVFAEQRALVDLLRADEVLGGGEIVIERGAPALFEAEHVWVAFTIPDATLEPISSTLSSYELAAKFGGGVTVEQHAGQDTTELEDRFADLVARFEAVVAANRDLGGLCTGLYVSAFEVRPSFTTEKLRRLTWVCELSRESYLG